MNEWILTKLLHLNCWDMDWLDFDNLDPIFKVTLRFRLMENGLCAPCFLKEWVDFDQTCTTIFLGHASELIILWWPSPHFQGQTRAYIVGKWLVCTLSPKGMDWFRPNLYIYIVVTWKKNCLDFGDLDPIFKVTLGLRLLENGFCTVSLEGMDGF